MTTKKRRVRNVLDGKITDWYRVTQCVAGSQSAAAQRKRARRESESEKEAAKEKVSRGKWALAQCEGAKHFIIHGSYIGRRTNFASRAVGNLSDIFGKQTETKKTTTTTKTHVAASPATICSINPLWEERKGARTASTHARADTHNRRWQIYSVHTHTWASQSRVFWQLLPRLRKHTHQSLVVVFFHPPLAKKRGEEKKTFCQRRKKKDQGDEDLASRRVGYRRWLAWRRRARPNH